MFVKYKKNNLDTNFDKKGQFLDLLCIMNDSRANQSFFITSDRFGFNNNRIGSQ